MRRLILLLLLMPLTAPAAGLDDFQSAAAEILERNRVPGAGIALVVDGEVLWAGGIGYADPAIRRPVYGRTLFRIGSVTKLVTALAVMTQVEKGALALEAPVAEAAPEIRLRNPWQDRAPVTLAQLLEHSAGLDDMHFRNMYTSGPLPDSLVPTLAALEDELEVRWQPGVMHSYANTGYAVAARLVEKATGQPFHRYVAEEILPGLGMPDARWGNHAEEAAQGYGEDGSPAEPRPLLVYPAGELSASPRDMAALLQFFIHRGQANGRQLLAPESLRRMETPATTRAARAGLDFGYGLGNQAMARAGLRLQGHDGGVDGFLSEFAYSPEHRFGYAILINRNNAATLNRLTTLATRFLAEQAGVPLPLADTLPVARQRPANITGCYRMLNSRHELLRPVDWMLQVMCVEVGRGALIADHPFLSQPVAFLPVQGTLLRERGEALPRIVYMEGEGLEDAIEWNGVYFERASRLTVMFPMVFALLTQFVMLTSLLALPAWLIRRAVTGRRDESAAIRLPPFFASLIFFLTAGCASLLDFSLLDTVNPVTLGILIGGSAFALASAFALHRVITRWRTGSFLVRWHALAVALSCAFLAGFLIYWRWIPLALWWW